MDEILELRCKIVESRSSLFLAIAKQLISTGKGIPVSTIEEFLISKQGALI